MSIAIPFLAFLLAGAFAAYHRLRLAIWAALTAGALVACWLLGANPVATTIAVVVLVLIAAPLLAPNIRKQWITARLLTFYTRLMPPLSDTERTALEAGGRAGALNIFITVSSRGAIRRRTASPPRGPGADNRDPLPEAVP